MSWKDVIIKHVTRKARSKTAVSYYLFVIFTSHSLFFLCLCSFGLAKKMAPLFQTRLGPARTGRPVRSGWPGLAVSATPLGGTLLRAHPTSRTLIFVAFSIWNMFLIKSKPKSIDQPWEIHWFCQVKSLTLTSGEGRWDRGHPFFCASVETNSQYKK